MRVHISHHQRPAAFNIFLYVSRIKHQRGECGPLTGQPDAHKDHANGSVQSTGVEWEREGDIIELSVKGNSWESPFSI